MPNKTLYIRDNDDVVWKKAETLVTNSGLSSLSSLVTDALRREVERIEAINEVVNDAKKIIIEIDDGGGVKKKAFHGNWVVRNYEGYKGLISVAVTKNQSYLVYYDSQSDCDDSYEVFEFFSDFIDSEGVPEELKSIVADKVGEDYVEYLDI